MSVSAPAPSAVRRAAARDLDRLAELWTALVEQHAALDPAFALRPGSRDRVIALLRRDLADPDARIFVWDATGDLLGFCVARLQRPAPLGAETVRGEVQDLGVRPDARRRGVGRALAEVALAWIRDSGVARVEVRVATRNEVGRRFWRALGFEPFVDVLQRRL